MPKRRTCHHGARRGRNVPVTSRQVEVLLNRIVDRGIVDGGMTLKREYVNGEATFQLVKADGRRHG